MSKKNSIWLFAFLFGAAAALAFPQSLTVTKAGEWGTGAYADVFIQGNYAYCAAVEAGLDIIEISSTSDPSKVGNYDTPGSAWDVFVSGSFAYVADEGSLQIINISNPASPTLAGTYQFTPGPGDGYAYGRT